MELGIIIWLALGALGGFIDLVVATKRGQYITVSGLLIHCGLTFLGSIFFVVALINWLDYLGVFFYIRVFWLAFKDNTGAFWKSIVLKGGK